MYKEPCIFAEKPQSCSMCLESCLLQCLLDHHRLRVTEEARFRLHEVLDHDIDSRVKDFQRQMGRDIVNLKCADGGGI